MKSLIAAALSLVLAIGFTTPAQAAIVQVNCSTSGSFTVTDNVVTSNTLCVGEADIPAGVTAIAADVFKASGLTAVKIPASVTTIGNLAFANSANLAEVTFKGNAPTLGTTPFNAIASNAKVNFYSPATGFGEAGSLWNGMLVNDLTPLPPFSVNAEVTSSDWRQGNNAAATATVTRKGATLSYTWYRCTDPVTATSGGVVRTTIPTGCIELPVITETVYRLPDTDTGWYITVLVKATYNGVTVASVATSVKPVLVPATSNRKLTNIGGYTAYAISPTSIMKLRIKGLLVTNPGYTRLHCVGDVKGYAKSAAFLKLGMSRAKSACAYAKSVFPYLTVTYSAKQSTTKGTKARLVSYTLIP